jgi:hypothetical protein
MRYLKNGLVAIAMICAVSSTAKADCIRIGAIGDGLTHDLAVIMSTHGLENIMSFKGRKGQGPVHTTCSAGAVLTECTSTQMACK